MIETNSKSNLIQTNSDKTDALPPLSSPPQSSIFKTCIDRITKVAMTALTTICSIFLFWANPTIFAGCFFIGINFSEQVKESISHIKRIWTELTLPTILLGSVALFLSKPVTLAATSALWAAEMGRAFLKQAQEAYEARKAKQT